MKSHVRAAVIGGGVVGCSVLYHLTKFGWQDVILIERSELTSGSTWHAAGGFHTLNGDPNVARLQHYTIELYKEIEEISGQSCGLHLTGGAMLAGTAERMDFLRLSAAKGRYLGLDMELISAEEAAHRVPLLDPAHFVGALWNPYEGHLDPSGTTHAYAKAARAQGAEIYLRNRVTDLKPRADGSWDVVTEEGTIVAEHVVNAGGLWAREVGRMVGLELPILAMEHHYLITEDMPEVAAFNAERGHEVPHVIDFEGEIYLRQERGGMLMGTYENAGQPWAPKETPWDFGHELLPPDIDRLAPSLERGFEHFPPFAKTGIKQLINGPFTFAPDGNPLVGPVRGLKNFWVACGVMAGFSQGGGVGLSLANWMIEGDPGADVWGMDVARFGDWTTMAFTEARVRENYAKRFSILFPNEERPAGRPFKTTPLYGMLNNRNAVFGAVYGLEVPLWYQEAGKNPYETPSFRRSNAHGPVGEECRRVRNAVGLAEISGFAKYRVQGPGAAVWLDALMANRLPKQGRLSLSPLLNAAGRLVGDFTLARLADDDFMIFGSGPAEHYHMRLFENYLPGAGLSLQALGLRLTGLALAGPRSREVLARLVDEPLENTAFPFLAIKPMTVGLVPALVGRISFTGELGYEIWVEPQYQCALFQSLIEAGRDADIGLFGGRALNSLRLEKSFGSWNTEFRPIYGPYEAGLGRFVALGKGNFPGREAAAEEQEQGPKRRLGTFLVKADDADALGNEPIWCGERVVGWVTSGGFGHAIGESIALGYIPADLAAEGRDDFAVEILGERRSARLLTSPPYDPTGACLRG